MLALAEAKARAAVSSPSSLAPPRIGRRYSRLPSRSEDAALAKTPWENPRAADARAE